MLCICSKRDSAHFTGSPELLTEPSKTSSLELAINIIMNEGAAELICICLKGKERGRERERREKEREERESKSGLKINTFCL